MYFIAKFCRICVQTNVKLLDLDTIDFDKVKLSEKLEVCTKMVVTKESLSSEICLQCLSKLRTSYQFLDMCRKSTKKLHGYYKTLLSKQENEDNLKHFVNTELQVVVTPISVDRYYRISHICDDIDTPCIREKRKRITKEQRCSLLKRLLSNSEQTKSEWGERVSRKYNDFCGSPSESFIGGLKNIIHFTSNFEFGIGSDKNSSNEITPLEKLTSFSDEFFRKDFSDFKNTILYIIENENQLCDNDDSDEEEYFNTSCDKEQWQSDQEVKFQNENEEVPKHLQNNSKIIEDSNDNIVKFEEVIVEPDIKIKTEMDYEEGECPENNSCLSSIQFKDEIQEEIDSHECFHPDHSSSYNSDYPITSSLNMEKVNSIMSLNNFVGNYQHKRTFSPNNVRCRTRENPYINPLLKQQFLFRSFKCDKCSRYFKSPGYLKAHNSKVH